MEWMTLLAFLGTAVVLTLAPGPDILFVIAQSMAQSYKAGIATALGLCTGLLVHISAAAIGISALIYQSSVAFTIVKYAGAVYLLYLAWQAFRAKDDVSLTASKETYPYNSLYKKGIIMNVLNPKVSLFFLALLPQFTNVEAGAIPLQMTVLGFIFLVQAFIIFSVVSLLAFKATELLRRSPKFGRRMNIVQGAIFTLIGLHILTSD